MGLIEKDYKKRDYQKLYKALNENHTVFDIMENAKEIEFKFNAKDIDFIAKFLKPQTSGADISPFSPRNFPKNSYTIPEEELEEYLKITGDVPQEDKLQIGLITNRFIKNILSKDKLYKTIDLKTDMRKKCLKGKEYIHSMGYWEKYIKYLKKELKKYKDISFCLNNQWKHGMWKRLANTVEKLFCVPNNVCKMNICFALGNAIAITLKSKVLNIHA